MHRPIAASVGWVLGLALLACAKTPPPRPDAGAADGGPPAARLHGLGFGPYVEAGQAPGQAPRVRDEELRRLLGYVARHAEGVRTYGASGDLAGACAAARAAGLRFIAGVWIGASEATNEEELASLRTTARTCRPDAIIVGNEVLLRGEVSEETLVAYVRRVQRELPGLPVTSAEEHQTLLQHPALLAAVDFLWVHYYPYWRGLPIEEAVAALDGWHRQVVSLAGGREVVVGETGWPSCGAAQGEAVPSPANAARHLLEVASWARATSTKLYYFEAFDEPWKAALEGPRGGCWGILGTDGLPKAGNEALFRGELAPDTWTPTTIPGGPGAAELRFTHVPAYGSEEDLEGQALHVVPGDHQVAVYVYVPGWGWASKPHGDSPMTSLRRDGRWRCDVTTGGADTAATQIKAFLLPMGFVPPVVLQSAELPAELEARAVARTEVARTP